MREAAVLLLAMYETITLTYSSPNRPMDDDVSSYSWIIRFICPCPSNNWSYSSRLTKARSHLR